VSDAPHDDAHGRAGPIPYSRRGRCGCALAFFLVVAAELSIEIDEVELSEQKFGKTTPSKVGLAQIGDETWFRCGFKPI
jgi:hypothetical protein